MVRYLGEQDFYISRGDSRAWAALNPRVYWGFQSGSKLAVLYLSLCNQEKACHISLQLVKLSDLNSFKVLTRWLYQRQPRWIQLWGRKRTDQSARSQKVEGRVAVCVCGGGGEKEVRGRKEIQMNSDYCWDVSEWEAELQRLSRKMEERKEHHDITMTLCINNSESW